MSRNRRHNKPSPFQWMNRKPKGVDIDLSPAVVDKGRSKLSRDGFYSSTPWIKTRDAYRKANPLCARCYAMGIIRPMAVVDHILPADDYPDLLFDWGNLQSLCDPCHNWKTAKDSAHRRGHKVKHLNQDLMDELEQTDFPIEDDNYRQ